MRLSSLVLKIRDRLHVIRPEDQVKDTLGFMEYIVIYAFSRMPARCSLMDFPRML
jgi:hypothetical protein